MRELLSRPRHRLRSPPPASPTPPTSLRRPLERRGRAGGAGADAAERGAEATGAAVDGSSAGLAGAGLAVACPPVEGVPACAYLDACKPAVAPSYQGCERGGDCTFALPEGLGALVLEVRLDCERLAPAEVSGDDGSWELDEDDLTLVLGGAACDRWRTENDPRLVVRSIHPCLR